MNFLSCQSDSEAALKVLSLISEIKSRKQGSLRLFLPTGRTPRPLYALFREAKSEWRGRLGVLQIDEFADGQRLFYNDLKGEILQPLELESGGEFIDPAWSDAEMKKHVASVTSRPIDIAVLGLGPNGHVGFHEPGQAADFAGGRVMISEETRARVPGASTREVLTFGAASFMKASAIIMIVSGPDKQKAYQRFLNLAPTPSMPATLLKPHPNFTIVSSI